MAASSSSVAARVALGERRLEPEHLVCPLRGRASIWPAGTAWSPIRGYVGLDARLCAGIPGRHRVQCTAAATSGCARVERDAVSAADRLDPRRPGLLPVPTTPRAGSSTWARPSRCATACPTTGRTRPSSCPARPRWWPRPTTSSGWWSDSEVDALILEHSLIQAHLPRFNVRLKDDKSYPWLAVTLNEEWPRPAVVRGRKRKGVRYFGPYGHAGAIRSTLDLLVRSFPVRTCSDTKFTRHERLGRPCLLYDIERCSGPCVGAVDHEAYDGYVDDLMRLPLGRHRAGAGPARGRDAARPPRRCEFERAARLRDRIAAVHKAAETQQMVSDRPEDFDVVGLAEDPLEASVQIFHVRRGRVVGHRGFVAEKVEDLSGPEFMALVVSQVYGADGAEVPRRRAGARGAGRPRAARRAGCAPCAAGPVDIAVPQRGAKRALQETVTRSAGEDLARHRLRRAADHNARSKALTELQAALSLREAPLRIECYDMSHLQGTDYVGSMVVLEDGLAKRSDYRRFKVKTVPGNDDYAAMEEVLTRRLTALKQAPRGAGGRAAHAASPTGPTCSLVDGGKGQLGGGRAGGARARARRTRSSWPRWPSSSRRSTGPGSPDPVRLRRGSDALYLLQRVRDEAHRFAITFHRERRGKRMTRSILDDIPGLGPARKARLVKELGGRQRRAGGLARGAPGPVLAARRRRARRATSGVRKAGDGR